MIISYFEPTTMLDRPCWIVDCPDVQPDESGYKSRRTGMRTGSRSGENEIDAGFGRRAIGSRSTRDR